jgi:hypothetical protein
VLTGRTACAIAVLASRALLAGSWISPSAIVFWPGLSCVFGLAAPTAALTGSRCDTTTISTR